ncbi:polyprotein [Frankliniella fusca]|uniref:Polyprotein n=1 Tax=Frankliniella fusca TaxID=407009 RepID=A0AAE1LCF3_9NEOP|nr:polyprotein [Frankliniella fusca]
MRQQLSDWYLKLIHSETEYSHEIPDRYKPERDVTLLQAVYSNLRLKVLLRNTSMFESSEWFVHYLEAKEADFLLPECEYSH